MSLLTILRSGVKTIDKVTQSLQADVQLAHFHDYGDGYGPILLPPVTLPAIVDWKQRQVRTPNGVEATSRSVVMFLDINELNAATLGEGVNDDDVITLPDGTTGPILDMAGFIDAGTGHPIATEVYLG